MALHAITSAVAILAKLRGKDTEEEIVLVKQYRPPLERVCIELPAGLIDAGETPEESALRELHEETGYVGKAIDSTVVTFNDPGLTNANMKMVIVKVRFFSNSNSG
jgi:ADP-ribose pyrophosphatase